MQLSKLKVEFLWKEMSKYKTLFSDFTRGNQANFLALLSDPYTYWIEILDERGSIVGVLYLTGLMQVIDANIHAIIFDRKATDKVAICKEVIEHMFDRFPALHRITATFPIIYGMTERLVRKIGFKFEGRKREVQLIGGKWVDEVTFGLLASEVTNG